MVPERVVLVDASVVMYAAGAPHRYQQPCVRIMEAVATGQLEACTDAEVLQEIAHRYFAIGRREAALNLLERLPLIFLRILPVRRDELLVFPALAAAHPRLGARDIVHLAVMATNALTQIVTADLDFDGIPGVERVDPEDLARTLVR